VKKQKVISPGEKIPSNEEHSNSRQQESWDLHSASFEINNSGGKTIKSFPE